MRRLKHPNNVLHFPTLSHVDVGLYYDANLAKAILSFKKDGINLPGGDSTLTAASGTLASGLKVAVAYTDDGIFKSKLLTLNAPAKAEDIYYNYGLTIQTNVKLPGVRTRHDGRFEKTYGGTLDVVETSGGYVTDAYKLEMEDNILDYITNDVATHSQETDPRVTFAGSIVQAFRVYKVATAQADLSGTNVVCTYTPSDGGSDVTVTLDQATAILNVDAANTDLASEPVIVVAGGASTYYFIGTTAGDKWYLSTATSTYSGTTTRHIALVAKNEEVQFDVEYMAGQWTQQNYGWQRLTYVDSGNTSWVVNGTAETIATGANAAAFVANIVAGTAGAAGYVYASKQLNASTTVDVLFLEDAYDYYIKPNDTYFTSVNTTNYQMSSTTGRYPSLTSDEVFRVVFNKKDGGRLSAMMRLDQPATNTTYAKYSIKCNFDIYGEPLASEDSTYVNEVHIYMPKTVAQTDYFDASDLYTDYGDTPTPDTTFEELIGFWCDLAVTSW